MKMTSELRFDAYKWIKKNIYSFFVELTLRNCSEISACGFEELTNLSSLQRLDLYRTYIETEPLVKILKASPHLKHINLGKLIFY
jgi:hypothetical protein